MLRSGGGNGVSKTWEPSFRQIGLFHIVGRAALLRRPNIRAKRQLAAASPYQTMKYAG